MKVLITGGAGFIGSHLAEYLLSLEHDVVVIDDLSTGRPENLRPLLDRPGFRFVEDAVTNETVMSRLTGESELIYHLAAAVGVDMAVRSPAQVIETNVMGTAAVLREANRHRCKVVLASTSEIYGKTRKLPFAEEDDSLLGPTTCSRWSYASSKAVDEFLGLAYWEEHGLPVLIVRLFNTIGPRQSGRYGMVVPRFVTQALSGEPLTVYGDGSQTRCFADVRDIVQAMVALSECTEAEGQVFNLGSTREIAIADLARLVISLSESSSDLVYVPYDQAYGPGFQDTPRRVPDISKVFALIGWEASIPLEESIVSVIEYIRSEARTG